MRRRFLFDASSLIYALKLKRLDLLDGNCIQWLTIYEVLNGIWKEAHLLGKLDKDRAIEFAHSLVPEALALMNILDPLGSEKEIMEVALKHGLSIYDTSYIILAEKHNLIFVTEDKELGKKAGRTIRVISLKEIL